MKYCVRCGKEIDVISKDPEKVFYCKKCSLEVLNINEEEIFKEEEKKEKQEKSYIYYLIPGTYQVGRREMLKAFFYFYSTLFLPLAWFVFFLFIFSLDSKNNLLIDGVKYYSIFVLIQVLVCYLMNAREVNDEADRAESDI